MSTTEVSSEPEAGTGAASVPALTLEELLGWSDYTFAQWEKLLAANPNALDLPCDIYNTGDVQGLLVHIAAAELRYGERLSGEPVTSYEQIRADLDGQVESDRLTGILATHRRGAEKLRAVLADTRSEEWAEMLEFPTLTGGTMRASRRKVFGHAVMHGIRHFAQLATLVRGHGIKPSWQMDFLGSPGIE